MPRPPLPGTNSSRRARCGTRQPGTSFQRSPRETRGALSIWCGACPPALTSKISTTPFSANGPIMTPPRRRPARSNSNRVRTVKTSFETLLHSGRPRTRTPPPPGSKHCPMATAKGRRCKAWSVVWPIIPIPSAPPNLRCRCWRDRGGTKPSAKLHRPGATGT